MKTVPFSYPATDSKEHIYGTMYLPDGEPRAVVQFVHGMDEHFGRYRAFAEYLTSQGYALVGEDHRGHGKSMAVGEAFGSFSADGDGMNLVLRDLFHLRGIILRHFPTTPYILMGHSLGSFLVRAMMLGHTVKPLCDAVILTGTGYHGKLAMLVARGICNSVIRKNGQLYPMNALMEYAGKLWNKRIPNPTSARDWCSSDPATIADIESDPLVKHSPTAGLFRDMTRLLLAVCDGAKETKKSAPVPVLLVSGEEDPIGDYGKGVAKTAELLEMTSPVVLTKLIPKMRHEVLLELNREEAYQTVGDFISRFVHPVMQKEDTENESAE